MSGKSRNVFLTLSLIAAFFGLLVLLLSNIPARSQDSIQEDIDRVTAPTEQSFRDGHYVVVGKIETLAVGIHRYQLRLDHPKGRADYSGLSAEELKAGDRVRILQGDVRFHAHQLGITNPFFLVRAEKAAD